MRLKTESKITLVHSPSSLAHLPHTDWGPKTLSSAIQLPLIFSVLACVLRSRGACDFIRRILHVGDVQISPLLDLTLPQDREDHSLSRPIGRALLW